VLGCGQPAHFAGPLLKWLGLLGPARCQSGRLARSAAAHRWTKSSAVFGWSTDGGRVTCWATTKVWEPPLTWGSVEAVERRVPSGICRWGGASSRHRQLDGHPAALSDECEGEGGYNWRRHPMSMAPYPRGGQRGQWPKIRRGAGASMLRIS
jgi:hypothetical protein